MRRPWIEPRQTLPNSTLIGTRPTHQTTNSTSGATFEFSRVEPKAAAAQTNRMPARTSTRPVHTADLPTTSRLSPVGAAFQRSPAKIGLDHPNASPTNDTASTAPAAQKNAETGIGVSATPRPS